MDFRKLPVYKIVIDLDENSETGMTCVSMVDQPAIEHSFELFNNQPKLAFAIQDSEKRIVTGPAVIQNMPIYRRSPDMGEYMVVFDDQAINDIMVKYSKQGLWNQVSFQHDGQLVDGVVMYEMYRKDTEKGITPKGYEDVADGSLFVSYKVIDDDLWEQIKNDTTLSGFSIEILADLEPTNEVADDGFDLDPDEMDVYDLLREILGDDVELLWSSEKKKPELDFAADWSVVDQAIENNAEISVKYGDKTVTGTPYAVYERGGSKNIALYNGEWHILNQKNVANIAATGKINQVDWIKAIGDPAFDTISKSMEGAVDVNKNPDKPKSLYEQAIIEHKVAMISYIDEVGKATGICVGNRQCGVFEYGYTRAGNAALRIYEFYGATHTPEELPGWRTLRLDRIRSFKIPDFLEPLTVAPAGFREIGMGEDRDDFVCMLRSDLKVG